MRKTKKMLVLVLSMLTLAAAALLTGCGGTTVDLNKYLAVKYDGADGYAKVTEVFDYDAFVKDYGEKIKAEGQEEEIIDAFGSAAGMLAEIAVDWTVTPDSGLSNGDEVTVKWRVDDETAANFGVTFKYEDKKVTVEGLEEMETFDAFAGVNIAVTGVSGHATGCVETDGTALNSYDYVMDKTENLANGDTVTVTISEGAVQRAIDSLGKIPAEESKTFPISGLLSYASSVSEITDDCIAKAEAQSEDVLKAHAAQEWDDVSDLVSMKRMGVWFLTPKAYNAYDAQNKLYLPYEVEAVDHENGGTFTYYWLIRFDDIAALEDGTCSMDYTNYEALTNTWFGPMVQKNGMYYSGYEDYDSMFAATVTRQIDEWNYEDTVQEQ